MYDDCEDGEDESHCNLLEIDEDTYKSQVAPRRSTKGVPWDVYVGVDIVAFPLIEAIEQKLTVVFHLTMRWNDNRLNYMNLKLGRQRNPLSPEVLEALWVPRLGLLNGLSDFLTIVTEDEAKLYRGYVWRRGKPVPNGLEASIESKNIDAVANSAFASLCTHRRGLPREQEPDRGQEGVLPGVHLRL